jgi:hypothetical protein
LSLTATDGGVSATRASVALTVESIAQEAAALQAQVSGLQAAGVLNQGQATSLIAKLDLKGNSGDIGKVHAEVRRHLVEERRHPDADAGGRPAVLGRHSRAERDAAVSSRRRSRLIAVHARRLFASRITRPACRTDARRILLSD